MSIKTAFENAIRKRNERGWSHIYVFVDIHQTILYPSYGKNKEKKFYIDAKETLQLLSKIDNIVLGLYTRSYPEDIAEYLDFFEDRDIHFELVNENSMEKSNKYGDFSKKPYYNVLIDDNAGFNAEEDWGELYQYILYGYLTKHV